MSRVALGEVCREYKGRPESDGLPVVGLEHLSQSDIDLLGWSYDETTFTKGFRKGHVLFGRRRAYLKKASVAPFDGVCSGDIIVIEAIEDRLLPDLLPFVIQNDYLFDFAVENSAGSLSPRVKWKDLSRFEFDLPSMEKQKELAELLRAAQEAKRVYSRLITACDEIIKSRFIEMFGDPIGNEMGWPTSTARECSASFGDGPFGSNLKSSHYVDEGIRVIRLGNIGVGFFIDDDKAFISYEHYQVLKKYECKPGQVIIGTLGEPNLRACLVPDFETPCIHKADCVYWETDADAILPQFAVSLLNQPSMLAYATQHVHGNTRGRVSSSQVASLPVILPPLALQQEFAAFVQQVDKSELCDEMAVAA